MTLLWLFFIVVGGSSSLYIAGKLLPKTYRNQATLLLRHPPEVVWEAIANMEALPVTGSTQHLIQPISEEGELPAWLIDMGASQITVQTVESDPPYALTRVMADSIVPMTTRYEYQLTPMGDGTDLSIKEEGYIDDGTWHVPIFRLTVRLTRGAGLKFYCRQLAEQLGETAVPLINKRS